MCIKIIILIQNSSLFTIKSIILNAKFINLNTNGHHHADVVAGVALQRFIAQLRLHSRRDLSDVAMEIKLWWTSFDV